MSTIIIDQLYHKVEEALQDRQKLNAIRNGIDKFLAENVDKLNVLGPLKRISFPQKNINDLLRNLDISQNDINKIKLEIKKALPYRTDYVDLSLYIPLALVTRFFLIQEMNAEKINNTTSMKDAQDDIKRCVYYTGVPVYALLQKKSFPKCDPNESCMAYAISNMIEKNRIRQTGSMLATIFITTNDCLVFYKERLIVGTDDTIIRYLNDVRTRLNSIMRKISNAYYDTFESGQYLRSEKEDMSDDNYYEADSNSQFIDRTTNKVVQTLITNGADMKLVELAAKNNDVSVADLRSYIVTICTEKQVDELRQVIESLLILFFSEESTKKYTVRDIGTDKFLLFALNIYKKSNTKNEHIIRIKDILDKWLKELHVYERTGTISTINNHRRSIYMFLTMAIIKINK